MVSEEVQIDNRVHSRIIGAKGRAINKIMDEYHVDVRFPGRDSEDMDLVIITGPEEAVFDCKDHLQNLEEEYVSCTCYASFSSPSWLWCTWFFMMKNGKKYKFFIF